MFSSIISVEIKGLTPSCNKTIESFEDMLNGGILHEKGSIYRDSPAGRQPVSDGDAAPVRGL